MRPRTDDEILEDLKDWPVRNIYVERGVRLIEQLRQRVQELEKERDHWKNNHETEVRRARILKERTDMPIERVQAYEKWGEDQSRIAKLTAERDKLLAALEYAAMRLDDPVDTRLIGEAIAIVKGGAA